jgi:erythromycin esterase
MNVPPRTSAFALTHLLRTENEMKGLLILTCAVAVMCGSAAPEAAAGQQDSLGAYLRNSTVAVRSIDPADEDFSDLEPLVRAIGSARIVQLGESSHGAGAQFKAKARLVKFLHQRLGFDVLIWESGLFDVWTVNTALREGADPTRAGQLGVFPIWSSAGEVRPLLEYVQQTASGPRPLEIAGFDMQFSSRDADVRLHDALVAFADAVSNAQLRTRIADLAGRMIRDYRELVTMESAMPGDLARFLSVVDTLRDVIAENRRPLEAVHSQRDVDFFLHAIANTREYGLTGYENRAADSPKDGPELRALRNGQWNRRDARNATVLLWLAREHYGDRKLIVWAHNGHVMNAFYAADWQSLSHEPQPGGMTPTGVFLRDSLGPAVYTIALTHYDGIDGFAASSTRREIPAAPEGSMERRLHDVGHPFSFVNLRGAPGELFSGTSLRLRSPFLSESFADLPRVIDGVFYIHTGEPATAWTGR